MKKTNIKSLLLLLIMLCTSMNSMAQFAEIVVDGIRYGIYGYTDYDSFFDYTSYYEARVMENFDNPYSGDITIPASIVYDGNTCPIVGIEGDAFRNCNVTSISVPSTVAYIGWMAFKDCTSLQSFTVSHDSDDENGCSYTPRTFEEGGTGIGIEAFYNCTSLSSVEIPRGVKGAIGASAFEGCSSIESINISEGITTISTAAFKGCNLSNVTLPDGLTDINCWAFCGNYNLRNINLPSSLRFIDFLAFSGCSIDDLFIPENVYYIGENAFDSNNFSHISVSEGNKTFDSRNHCNALIETATNTLLYGSNNTIVPDGIKTIGEFAFSRCGLITNITLPESVTNIGAGAFCNCYSLKSVNIPEHVTKINAELFEDCTKLENINIPYGVTTIGNRAFSGCRSLKEMIIPEGVITIGEAAFDNCWNITSLTLPSTLKGIEFEAFHACQCLTSVIIPNSMKSINNYVFSGCKNLTSVTIPNSITSIGYSAFQNCSNLTTITIPSSVVEIYGNAFQYCDKLDDVINLATTPQKKRFDIDGYVFPFSHYGTLHVLPGCKAAYEKEDIWKNFTIVEDVTDGIKTTKTENEKENIFTIDGRRMNELEAGKIIIKNGKKYIPRNI